MNSLDPKKFDKYLPIGSVVMLNNGIKTLMIIGYQRVVKNKLYDYVSIPFPEGMLDANSPVFFNHKDISLILFLGYFNKTYAEFDKFLKGRNDEYSFIDPRIIEIGKKYNEKS